MGGKQKLAMSFHELLEGVGKGHAIAAGQPGAMKIDPQMRREIVARSLGPSRVMHEYNAAELLGPGVQVKRSARSNTDKDILEFTRNGNDIPTATGEPGSYVTIYRKNPGEFRNDLTSTMHINASGGREPVEFNTMGMPTGLGSNVYQMLWDMARAGNRANVTDILTPINQIRRPGNLMSNIITHGDSGNTQLFGATAFNPHPLENSSMTGRDRAGAEVEALKSVIPDTYVRETALNTRPDTMFRYSPLAQVGVLGLREMQLAKAHGSKDVNYLGAPLGQHRLTSLAHPMDLDQLKHATQVARREGTYGWEGAGRQSDDPAMAFGTGLMGRAGTTEALIRGMHEGRTPEEIMEDLMKYRGAEEALHGRYADGGAIHAAVAD